MSLSQIAGQFDLAKVISVIVLTGVLGWAGHNLMRTVEQTADTANVVELMRQEQTYKVQRLQEHIETLQARLQKVVNTDDLVLRDERYASLLARIASMEERLGRVEQINAQRRTDDGARK